jgi:hypothetical protein
MMREALTDRFNESMLGSVDDFVIQQAGEPQPGDTSSIKGVRLCQALTWAAPPKPGAGERISLPSSRLCFLIQVLLISSRRY